MECLRVAAVAFVLVFFAVPTSAEPPEHSDAKTQPISGLGVRQQHVEQLMQQLEEKFLTLSQSLSQNEPERAARLQKALVESKQLSLEQRMATIARLLDDSNLDQATDEQKKVLKDLEHLAELLVRDGERDEKLLELQRLEQWRDQVGRLVDAERSHLREADKLADKQKTLAELQKQIEAVEKLIERQQGLIRQTEEARQQGIDALGRIADGQHDLRNATQKLAEQVAGANSENSLKSPAPSDGHPGGQPPSQSGQQQSGQSGDKSSGQSGDKSPSQPGPQSGDQGNQKAGDSKAGGKKSGSDGAQPGDQPGGQPGSGQSGEDQPGAAPLGQAAKQQEEAEKNLANGRGKAGVQKEQAALAKLHEALEQLKQEKARIASLPPAALDKLAEKQGATADKTQKLGDDIAKAGGQSGQPGGEQGDPQNGEQGSQSSQGQPGQRQIQQAQQKMREAEKQLGKHQPAGAVPPAADAVDKLKQALREIEDRLAQLREEERLEKLARLEARFREILVRQQAATLATAAVEKKRQPEGTLHRSEIIMVSKLTDEERALAELVFQALQIIRDDGTSVVFQHVVDHLHADLKRVTGRLEQKQTGRATHAEQVEIEVTLQELVAALEEAQKKPKKSSPGKSSGQSSSSDQDDPLMPGSAELKLLRAAQQRVNRMTGEFDKEWAGKPRDTAAGDEIRRIADRQQDINIMTDQMIQGK